MQAALSPANARQHRDEVGSTEQDMMSSQRSNDVMQSAKDVIRKNSNRDDEALIRQSKNGPPVGHHNLNQIAEESYENSRVINSGDVDAQDSNAKSGGLQDMFDQTAA